MTDIKSRVRSFLLERISDRDTSLTVQQGDSFIVSFPRSGNTWMRFLLAYLLVDESKVTFPDGLDDVIIDIYQRSNNDIASNPYDFRIFKSHTSFRTKYSKNKVVYLVRDPRDVVLSCFNYSCKRWRQSPPNFEEFFKAFLHNGLQDYGTWGENAGSWLGGCRHSPNFLPIRFEDMLANPRNEFEKVLRFLNLEPEEEAISNALRLSSFSKLKAKEKREGNPQKSADADASFFRQGKSSGWTQHLSKSHIHAIEGAWAPQMKDWGYL